MVSMIPFSFHPECIQLFIYFSLTPGKDKFGYSHFPCNLSSARLCLFYCFMNRLLYFAYKN